MAHNVTVTQKSDTLAAISLILARRATCNTLKAARNARKWLTTRHDFLAADGDPIQCTGLQIIGCSLAFLVVSFLLSIHF